MPTEYRPVRSLGLDKAIEDCKYRMSRYSVTPNMLIVPPQVSAVPSTRTQRTRRVCVTDRMAVR